MDEMDIRDGDNDMVDSIEEVGGSCYEIRHGIGR